MELTNGTAVATIDEHGGRVASLVVDGLEVLVTEGAKPTRWGSFPMIPWCGRLPYGRLDFDGAVHEFPITSPPHANHGVTHLQRWHLTSTDDATAELAVDLASPWPFGGRATQRFTLDADQLMVTAEVVAGERPMPAMIGWHPWFRRQLDRGGPAELTIAPGAAYAVDDDDVPTGELVAVPPEPWNACFVDVADMPQITWPGALTLTVSSPCDHWVVFTEPDHALCVEPQTGPPNQFHLQPVVLDPGCSLVASMTLAWSAEQS